MKFIHSKFYDLSKNLFSVIQLYSDFVKYCKAFIFKEYDFAHALIQTSDGGFALAGYTSSFGAGRDDMQLVKTDANGVASWNQTYGGTDWESASALIQTSDGGFALAGSTSSFGAGYYDIDMLLVITDANGVIIWYQTYGGIWSDSAQALIQTSDGDFALAGYTGSFGVGRCDMWLVIIDASELDLTTTTTPGLGTLSLIVAVLILTTCLLILFRRYFR